MRVGSTAVIATLALLFSSAPGVHSRSPRSHKDDLFDTKQRQQVSHAHALLSSC
jgi:hypothetical protein